MPTHLTTRELALLDQLVRARKPAIHARARINRLRAARGISPISLCTVRRFFRGATHRRGLKERRGRPSLLRPKDVKSMEQARLRLLKEAAKPGKKRRVTHDDVQQEAGLLDRCCSRTAQDALRASGVRFRPPRSKVYLTSKDAKERLRVAKSWVKRPTTFWIEGVHAYVDNKAFPLPLTPAQKAKMQKTRVTGHLRRADEGLAPYCTKPKEKHSFIGIPSATITAAVAKDRIIMWHVVPKSWNGAAAAAMYTGPLSAALKRTWGPKRRYVIVEDGDRKGNQSGQGLSAKQKANIRAMTLPPRTPSWMPLDFALWHAIDEKMETTAPDAAESKAEYLARLERVAKSLPRAFVRKVLGRMRDNIQGVIEAGGYHAKND